jgi:hypothetical protein
MFINQSNRQCFPKNFFVMSRSANFTLMILFLLSSLILTSSHLHAQDEKQMLYAATVAGYDHSSGVSLSGAGVYRSSVEYADWQRVSWTHLPVRALTVLEEENPQVLLLGTDDGIMRPFSNTSGWKILTDWRVRDVLDLVVDPFQPEMIYAATGLGVFVSNDTGATWTSSNHGLKDTFVSCLLPDPQMPGRVLAGAEAGLFESSDYGQTWRPLALEGIAIRALLRQPISPGIFWVGTEYHGLINSPDGGHVFTPVTLGEDSLSIYSLAGGNPGEPIVAGSFDRGLFMATEDDPLWRHLEGSEQFGTVFSIAMFESGQKMYFGTHGNGVWRTTDGGANWESFGLTGADVRKLLSVTVEQSP